MYGVIIRFARQRLTTPPAGSAGDGAPELSPDGRTLAFTRATEVIPRKRGRRGLLNHPAVGASWEGFVIEQVLDWLAVSRHSPEAFFFRASDGTEIDLLFRHRKALWAVEVKLTSAPSEDDFRKLDRAAELIGARRRVLVSQTAQSVIGRERSSCTLPELLALL